MTFLGFSFSENVPLKELQQQFFSGTVVVELQNFVRRLFKYLFEDFNFIHVTQAVGTINVRQGVLIFGNR